METGLTALCMGAQKIKLFNAVLYCLFRLVVNGFNLFSFSWHDFLKKFEQFSTEFRKQESTLHAKRLLDDVLHPHCLPSIQLHVDLRGVAA